MSEKKAEDEAPKKKGGKLKAMVVALVLLAVGGGAMFGLMAAGIIPGMGSAEGKEENKPRLIRKGEEDPYAAKGESEKEGVETVHGEGGREYRTIYFVFDGEFTSNLRNSPSLIQVTLAASTRRDSRVLMWMKEHELAIRSQLLVDLADTPEEDVATPQGKIRLQRRLTESINRILTEEEGFGGIDQVYFRSLIIQ